MNTFTVSNAVVLEYSKDVQKAVIEKNSEYGKYIYFRILEKNYNHSPTSWFCVVYDTKTQNKIINMDLKPGDNICVSGKLVPYTDDTKRKVSYRFEVKDIDFLYCGMKHKKSSPTQENISLQSIETIDLSKCDIFQQNVGGEE